MLTGAAIADAVLRYAAALARVGTAATVEVPGRTEHGIAGRFKFLIGPASEIIVEPTDDEDELEDEAFVAWVEEQIHRLERPPTIVPVAEPPIRGFDEFD